MYLQASRFPKGSHRAGSFHVNERQLLLDEQGRTPVDRLPIKRALVDAIT